MQTDYRFSGTSVRALKLAGLAGVAGPIMFVGLVVVGAALDETYSHVTQKISELGGESAANPQLQNLNFILLGGSLLAFSWALRRLLGPPFRGSLLVGYFGVVAVIHGALLRCDVGCAGKTTEGLLHNISGLTSFLATIGAMFLLARRWKDDSTWRSHAIFSQAMAFVALVGLLWFIYTQAAEAKEFAGVAQRTMAGALLVWVSATSARLHRETRSLSEVT